MVIRLNVKLRKLGILPHYSFMAGFPHETEADFRRTLELIEFLKEQNPSAVIWEVNRYVPYPHTKLFTLAIKNGFAPSRSFEE